ncbi:type 4 pilus major pilin [Stenotrophomonas geniculata]|uniref:type 4 pilus major pilin n=1 Tax=Pseudomonadota TaxID=1224 RepID=UPI0009EBB1FE|nr:type 4 pilus major pilin [Achromobacter sp. 2789STDY5608633]
MHISSRSQRRRVDQDAGKGCARKGATLLEVGMAFIIAVAMLAVTAAAILRMVDDSDSRLEVGNVRYIAESVRQTKKVDGFPVGTDIQRELVELSLLPHGVDSDPNGTIRNRWAGNVTITTQDGRGNFAVTYSGLPEHICRLVVLGVHSGLLQTVGAGNAPSTSGGSGSYLIATLTSQQIKAVCAGDRVYWSTGGK